MDDLQNNSAKIKGKAGGVTGRGDLFEERKAAFMSGRGNRTPAVSETSGTSE